MPTFARRSLAVAVLLLCGRPPVQAGPVANWQRLPDAPFRGYAAAAVDPGGHLYAYGGDKGIFATYSTQAGRWRALTPPTTLTVAGISALAAVAGRVYGFTTSTYTPAHPDPDNAFVYQVATDRWRAIAFAPSEHGGGAAVVVMDGSIYVMAGGGLDGYAGNSVEAYDPRTGTWKRRAGMRDVRTWPAAVAGPDGRIYVLGGLSEGAYGRIFATNSLEAYDLHTNRWTTLAPMHTPRVGPGAAVGRDGRIYAIGGTSDPVNSLPRGLIYARALATVEVYDPRTNRWSAGPNLGVARWGLAAAALPDGAIYAIGGRTSSDAEVPTVERLPLPAH